jgi:uncharacterized protein YceH (UPF0502 family)
MEPITAESARFAGPKDLSPSEVRVLGCLLEKQRTTPDAYPLSLNALRLACNQSTNRDPVLDYDETVVREALHRLERRGFTRLASGAGSRAPKYRHLLEQVLPMDTGEQAIICVLMLRGAQTPGELKQRTERLHAFVAVESALETLQRLIERGLVSQPERRPGQKEGRYRQLLGAEEQDAEPPRHEEIAAERGDSAPAFANEPATLEDLRIRVAALEREVGELHAAMRNPSAEHKQ